MGAPDTFQGYAVAIYSLGAFVSNPLFGYWADKKNTKLVISICMVLCFVGNLGYAMCAPIKSKWALLVSRLIVGSFAGSTSVISAHISEVTSQEERTKWMSLNSAGFVLGFIIGPAFSLAFTYVDFKIGWFPVNQYTMAGYAAASVAFLAIPVILFGFTDVPPRYKQKKLKHQKVDGKSSFFSIPDENELTYFQKKKVEYSKLAFILCVIITLVITFWLVYILISSPNFH